MFSEFTFLSRIFIIPQIFQGNFKNVGPELAPAIYAFHSKKSKFTQSAYTQQGMHRNTLTTVTRLLT